jgi:hypothetical protein
MIGNIYFCFKEIDETGELFKSWLELTAPIWEMVGTDLTDTTALKRWLAFLEGGLLPIISLTSLHFFVKYDNRENEKANNEKNKEYFDSRNKKIEEIVESKTDYNPMTENIEDEINEYITPGGRHVDEDAVNNEVKDKEVIPTIKEEVEDISDEGNESNFNKESNEIETSTNPTVKNKGSEMTKIETATGKVKYKKRIK